MDIRNFRVVFGIIAAIFAISILSNQSAFATSLKNRCNVSGALSLIVADRAVDGKLTTLLSVDEGNGRSRKVDLKGGARKKFNQLRSLGEITTGDLITISGTRQGSHCVTARGKNFSIDSTSPDESLSLVSGNQTLLVIALNLSDYNLNHTTTELNTIFLDGSRSTSALFQESSNGLVTFSGTVAGPFNINSSYTSCDWSGWGSAGDSAAQSAGYNLANYQRIMYVVPYFPTAACSSAGRGTIGGSPSRAWVKDVPEGGLAAHELGHNFGMDHAVTFGTNQGDFSDPMGGSLLTHNNAPHKIQMGWASAVQANQSGTYTVSALSLDPAVAGGPQIFTLPKSGTNLNYYISYRKFINFDANLPKDWTGQSTYEGLAIHTYSSGYAPTTLLATLRNDGESFTDGGTTFSLTSHTATQATFQLSVAAVIQAPTISISPSSQSGAPGSTLTYGVNLTNRDSGVSNGSTFNLSFSGASGLAGTFSSNSLTLAPGASGNVTLAVSSSSSMAAGGYNFTVAVSDLSQPAHNASSSASYTVVIADTTNPVVTVVSPINGSTLPSSGNPNITLSGQATDAGGLAQMRIYLNGSLKTTCRLNNGPTTATCAKSIKLSQFNRGTNTIMIDATDRANRVGSSSVTVTRP